MLRQIRNKNGFTLIELLVVTTIIALVISSIGAYLVNNMRAFNLDRDQMDAQQTAQEAMEKIINLTIDAKSISGSIIKDVNNNNLVFALTGTRLSYTLGLNPEVFVSDNIEVCNISENTNRKGINITITSNINGTKTTIRNQIYFRNR